MNLKTENLRKVFRTDLMETIALDGVSIDVKEGEKGNVIPEIKRNRAKIVNSLSIML